MTFIRIIGFHVRLALACLLAGLFIWIRTALFRLLEWSLVLILISGCSTAIYENGQPIAHIQADAVNITIRKNGTYFHADRLNHSTPTRAGGSVVGTAAAGAVPIVTAIAR